MSKHITYEDLHSVVVADLVRRGISRFSVEQVLFALQTEYTIVPGDEWVE